MQLEINRSDGILHVAENLFRAKGYHATSMSEVAEKCGIQKASLYHHYGSKEVLAVAVMTKVQVYFDTVVFCYAYDETLSHDVRLLKMNKAIEQYFSVESGCLFANFAIEQMESIAAFVAPIQRYFSSWLNAYQAIFSQIYNAEAAKSLASDFLSDLQGALIMTRVSGNNGPLLRLFRRSSQTLQAGIPLKQRSPQGFSAEPRPRLKRPR